MKRQALMVGGGKQRRDIVQTPAQMIENAMEDYDKEDITKVLQEMGTALPSDIATVKDCFETQEILQEYKAFGGFSLKELIDPTWGFAPFDASKMYDLFVGGQLDGYQQEGMRVATAMGSNCGPWLSVTKVCSYTEHTPIHTMIPARMLPDIFKRLLPPAGWGIHLHDFSSDHYCETWYDKSLLSEEDQDSMHGSWKELKTLGEEAKKEMCKWGCTKPPKIGWFLTILRG